MIKTLSSHWAIGLKWVFKTKSDEHGHIVKHKAWLAKGYVQQHGVDFDEVFAPVARLESVRTILVVAVAADIYFHDILYDFSNSTSNSTSTVVAKPTALLQSMNTSVLGMMVVFNGPMTEGKALPPSLEETTVRAQGLYFYNKKQTPADAWFAFSVVFNSTGNRGTLNVMGEDLFSEKTRDLSVVGGTSDFFMARGVATLRGDAIEGFTYFRLQMDIKLYEYYV
ncbi:hypothetical protein E2562_013330 [Oryza meyeriana var. granulata]|uniref:Dirigent protein n=1 Tax=Oryza meyeriana var. granulata TaxID=110450 RepID=A0A6G1D3I4_9ORYZ|nr:hypothetical protein E2562_013330 [Oryza meyeriana var. granulata]